MPSTFLGNLLKAKLTLMLTGMSGSGISTRLLKQTYPEMTTAKKNLP